MDTPVRRLNFKLLTFNFKLPLPVRDHNACFFTGHLSTEVRPFTTAQEGKPGAEFTLAVGDTWRDATTGQPQKRTDFIGIVCYGDVAATALKLRKGDSIFVTGKMRNEVIPGPEPESPPERKTKLRALTLATHRPIKAAA